MLQRYQTIKKILLAFSLFFVFSLGILSLTKGEVLVISIKVTKSREAQRSAEIIKAQPEPEANTLAIFPDVDPNVFFAASSDGKAITANQPNLNTPLVVLDPLRLLIISAYLAWGLTTILALLVALAQVCSPRLSLKKRTRYFRLLYLALICFALWLLLGSVTVTFFFVQTI